jgi:hypothetical protein
MTSVISAFAAGARCNGPRLLFDLSKTHVPLKSGLASLGFSCAKARLAHISKNTIIFFISRIISPAPRAVKPLLIVRALRLGYNLAAS